MKNLAMLLMLVMMMFFTGCVESTPTVDVKTANAQERLMKQGHAEAGIPNIKNFREKKQMKMLYELRDQEDLICYAYLFNERNGTIGQYLGQCLGYGLPASTQYSNPERRMRRGSTSGYSYNIPQAEPNGLFMPEGLSATWLMMIDPKTKDARPVYIEPLIMVSPFPLHK